MNGFDPGASKFETANGFGTLPIGVIIVALIWSDSVRSDAVVRTPAITTRVLFNAAMPPARFMIASVAFTFVMRPPSSFNQTSTFDGACDPGGGSPHNTVSTPVDCAEARCGANAAATHNTSAVNAERNSE